MWESRRARVVPPPMDDAGIRTMLIGLFLGMALYAGGLIARITLPEPYNLTAWFLLTIGGLIVVTGWFVATRYRGFRIRRLGRAKTEGKRAKGRRVRDQTVADKMRRRL